MSCTALGIGSISPLHKLMLPMLILKIIIQFCTSEQQKQPFSHGLIDQKVSLVIVHHVL